MWRGSEYLTVQLSLLSWACLLSFSSLYNPFPEWQERWTTVMAEFPLLLCNDKAQQIPYLKKSRPAPMKLSGRVQSLSTYGFWKYLYSLDFSAFRFSNENVFRRTQLEKLDFTDAKSSQGVWCSTSANRHSELFGEHVMASNEDKSRGLGKEGVGEEG